MAVGQSIADRERAAASRAIRLGHVAWKYLGTDDLPYVLQTENGLTLEQLEELLNALEDSGDQRLTKSQAEALQAVLDALYGLEALGHAVGLDPANELDRTALAGLVEREARRAARTLDSVLTYPNGGSGEGTRETDR